MHLVREIVKLKNFSPGEKQVIRTTLPIGTGVIRIQVAVNAKNSLHEALGKQHLPPKSVEMVEGDIERLQRSGI